MRPTSQCLIDRDQRIGLKPRHGRVFGVPDSVPPLHPNPAEAADPGTEGGPRQLYRRTVI